MSKWLLPLAVFGLGSVGVLALSDRGLDALEWMAQRVAQAPEALQEWNDAAQLELDRIQNALDRMTQTLEIAQ